MDVQTEIPGVREPSAGAIPPPKAQRKPGRPPMSPEKRQQAAEKAAMRRRMNKLKAAKDLREWERMARAELGEAKAANEPPRPTGPSEVVKPGWPPPSQIEAHKPLAEAMWQRAAQILEKTERYKLDADKLKVLVEGTSPVLAKYLPALGDTPEVGFGIALLVVFGPPLVEDAIALLTAPPKPKRLPTLEEQPEDKAA